MKIFLAGGIKSEWQTDFAEEIRLLRPDADVYNPQEHLVHDPRLYTERDLGAIETSDLVIANLEPELQRWAEVVFRIGYAIALRKRVLLVDSHGAQVAHGMHQKCDVFGDLGAVLTALPHMKEFRRE